MTGLKSFYTHHRITFVYILLWPFLFLLSLLYGLTTAGLQCLYQSGILKSYRSVLKVVSIGNITLGGSGKTPLAEYVAGFLSREGHRVAILLRGYMTPKRAAGMGSKDYYIYGDEASMLKANLKNRVLVVSGKDRVRLVRQLEKEAACDTILLDDGFQHRALSRDLDIVAIDATNPFGMRSVLPLGHLREGLSSLRRAGLFCLTRCDEASVDEVKKVESLLKNINPSAGMVRSIHAGEYFLDLKTGGLLPADFFKGAHVALLCGIANPLSFHRSVEKLGAVVKVSNAFRDHYDYSPEDIFRIQEECLRLHIKKVITTQKDAVRLTGFLQTHKLEIDILALKISLKVVQGEEVLRERLFSLYHS
jgi:tetraacyldisaccharide 4'-kinase